MAVGDELLKQLEAALAEVEHLRRVVSGKDEIIRAKDDAIAALTGLDSINRLRISALVDANKERAAANQIDSRLQASYEKSLADFRLERERLMRERDSARAARKWWVLAGAVAGAAIARSVR